MVQQTNSNKLRDSWRALAGSGKGEGWRTIAIEMKGNCRILAGRLFPADEEAILVGFNSANVPKARELPQALGFQVNRLEKNILADGNVWISLARLPAGSLEMFCLMAEDIVDFLSNKHNDAEENILRSFLGRIRAWQSFMDHGTLGVLSNEAETGLFGELTVLQSLLKAGIPMIDAITSWQGPISGLQDFFIGNGSLEVKTTVSQASFPAKFGSLEQLDNTLRHPIYLAGVRLDIGESGHTLPQMAYALRKGLFSDQSALALYDNLLIEAGLLEVHAESYTRKFQHLNTSFYFIDENFPKLTPDTVRPEIRRASYEIDLALVKHSNINLTDVIKSLRGE